jgi:U3 small nucleolar RNA-associated protein 23
MPLIVLTHSAINLESPSFASTSFVDEKTEKKLKPTEEQIERIKKLKKKLIGDGEVKRLHRRKKVKGPNPLSCLKSKKTKAPKKQST